MGKWFEIAKLPNWFQRNCRLAIAYYKLKKDYIQVINVCKKPNGNMKDIEGKAKLTDKQNIFKVRFSIFTGYSDYIIEFVDKDYQHAIVGSNSRKYLWILSRNAFMEEKTFNELIKIAKRKGYDVSRLERTR